MPELIEKTDSGDYPGSVFFCLLSFNLNGDIISKIYIVMERMAVSAAVDLVARVFSRRSSLLSGGS